ncbi:unnamed protein product [Porites lobata]|uniref:Transposase Helix-turn-helix domain-containing protein n=1 Tax=Porites lobata TaxID=104759 RepID=A0ABN8RKK5_9CNID|nr:unnamed protein product [Porites lobata]
MVKKNVKKLTYWTGPVKSTRKGRNFKKDPKKFGPKREITEKDEFLLTMMKLRLGPRNADLAQRFAVFATTVTNISTTWVKLLASELGCLIYNPSYEVFRKTLPTKFHKPGYSKWLRSFLQQLVGQEFPFPMLQMHEQPVLASLPKRSSPIDDNKASERQNAKSSLHQYPEAEH